MVLELKNSVMNDKFVAVSIKYQDMDRLPRGKFKYTAKNGVKIKTDRYPDWSSFSKTLWLKGSEYDDDTVFIIAMDELDLLLEAVDELNSYFEQTATVHPCYLKGTHFYYIDGDGEIKQMWGTLQHLADNYISIGNCFKTVEEATHYQKQFYKLFDRLYKEY